MTVQPSAAATALSDFARDVRDGLSRQPKMLSSKYFYDEAGDKLFQRIMAMPEYYLTDCELEIFQAQRADILRALGEQPFDLIELGAGDGLKTQVLLEHFLEEKVDFAYRPIDISGHVLDLLTETLAQRWPKLEVDPVQGDYFTALSRMSSDNRRRKVVLFLGSNIGNFDQQQAAGFLRRLRSHLAPGDLTLIGFDLKKDPAVILAAYNDPAGITAAFNLNLLRRINSELGGNFNLDAFRHWETYNPVSGEAKSYLISTEAQHVTLKKLRQTFHFDAWEAIDVEVSRKYSRREIDELAHAAGMRTVRQFTDQRGYFVDALWQF